MKKIIFTVTIFLLLFGCNTERHWQKVATDTNVTQRKKAIIAPKVAILFPAREIYLPGEKIITRDTVVDVEGIIELNSIIDSLLYYSNNDSIRTIILERFKPVKVIVREKVVDTIYVPETAKLYSLVNDLEVCEVSNVNLAVKLENEQQRSNELTKSKHFWLWWFIGACVILAGSIYLNFKK